MTRRPRSPSVLADPPTLPRESATPDPSQFCYDAAFDRNLGWLTTWEQVALRAKRVAIAGLGGAGGAHLLTLARLGIGAFTIADFDRFELPNFNRQVGATMATLGRPKAAVLEEMALAINPQLHIRRFDTAIATEHIDAFLDGAHLFADGASTSSKSPSAARSSPAVPSAAFPRSPPRRSAWGSAA